MASPLAASIARLAQPIEDDASLDPLLDRLGDARIVMLGEASHGTSEFYSWRARITMRLLAEHDAAFVAVEGDWPECFHVNRYIRGEDVAGSATEAVGAFQRWPTWMWANAETAELVAAMRARGDAGFYGLDIYSLWESMRALIARLDDLAPQAAHDARSAWACLDPYGEAAQRYAVASSAGRDCSAIVERALQAARGALSEISDAGSRLDIEQNAVVAVNAESYYRAMIEGGASSWNIRDTHMMNTLDRLLAHHGPDARAVVWAHNTHIGDARATDMASEGMTNLGQLARERHGRDAVALVGFGSHRGSVIAARGWDEPMRQLPVPPARPGSLEDAFHEAVPDDCFVVFDDTYALREEVPHRAIGVVYHPESERANYVPTTPAERYDAFVHLDRTNALRPLHVAPIEVEVPETYPWGY